MKKLLLSISILFVCASAYTQQVVTGNNNGLVYTIPEVEDWGTFDLFVKKGGLFPLTMTNYQSGSVAWGIICNDPTIDTLNPHCGVGHYVVTYQKSNGNPSTLHLYIKYLVDIYSLDYDDGTYWLLPESSIQLKSGPNFSVVGFKKVGADDNTVIWDSIYTVTEPGAYCAGAVDGDGYTSSDTVLVAHAINPICPLTDITNQTILFRNLEAGVMYTLLEKKGDSLIPVPPSKDGGAGTISWSSLDPGTYKLKAETVKDGKAFEYVYANEFVINNPNTGISEIESKEVIIINRNIYIFNNEKTSLKIYNISGIKILEQDVEGDQNIYLDFNPGIYIIMMTSNSSYQTKKIIIQ